MAKRRHRASGGGRTTPKGTQPKNVRHRRAAAHEADPVPEIVTALRAALAESTPLALLESASMFVEAITERRTDHLGPKRKAQVDGPDMLGSLLDPGWPELVVLGRAMAQLLADRPIVRRLADQQLPSGSPAWASWMHEIEVTGTHIQNDPLGDGDNLWVSVQWRDGFEVTAILFVDHNMGSMLKDAFLVPGGRDDIMATMRDVDPDAVPVDDLDPAELRARFERSLERTDMTLPVVETETWPNCRPLIEWIVGHLPPGGTVNEAELWTEQQRDELVDEFVASSYGGECPLPSIDVRSIAESFVWHGCDFGSGDPLRWSSVVVEIVLTDWFPRKVYGMSQTHIDAVPAVLEHFVAFAHERREVDPRSTLEVQSSIVIWEDDFYEAMAHQRPRSAHAADIARMAMGLDLDDDDFDDDDFDDDDDFIAFEGDRPDDALLRVVLGDRLDPNYMDAVTDQLEAQVVELVGGREAYESLDDRPLGDVDFDWSVVPADMVDLTRETLGYLDRWSIEHFDSEVRSIARVTLGAVVVNDRSVFKRSARTEVLAAGILGYLINRLAGRFDRRERETLEWTAAYVSPFAQLVGLNAAAVGARVKTIGNVMERANVDWPHFLHSTQRRTALETKRNVIEYRSGVTDRD